MVAGRFKLLLSSCALCVGIASGSVPAHAQFEGPPVTTPVPEQLTGPAPAAAPVSTPSFADVDTKAKYAILLNIGDQLEVTVVGVPALSAIRPQVDGDGNIALPYIGTLHVAGISVGATESLIAQKYREGDYLVNPQVNIQLLTTPTQMIAVTGEVKTATVVPALGERRLLEVIAAAGGFTPQASHLVTIVRKSTNEAFQVVIDSDPLNVGKVNVPVFAGDTIIVPRAGEVYVIGSVKTPSAIPLVSNTPLTVMQALSISGGVNFEGALSQVRIIRTEGVERKAVMLDLKRVLDGKEADPILQADDIIYVPANAFKGGLKANAVSVITSALLAVVYLAR
jgi:polysaccharide export outer membrane protein